MNSACLQAAGGAPEEADLSEGEALAQEVGVRDQGEDSRRVLPEGRRGQSGAAHQGAP